MRTGSGVDRPVFLVGCGRSGTTLLYNIMCGHPDMGWFSNYTNRWCAPPLAVLSRTYPLTRRLNWTGRAIPAPAEADAIWDWICSAHHRSLLPPLDAADVHAGEAERAAHAITSHLKWQRRPRFCNKNTTNTRRVRYLSAMFPSARFVHVIRDPRGSVASLLRVSWWPTMPVWFHDGATPLQLAQRGHRMEDLAAEVWQREVACALEHASDLPQERYLEVRYEELMARPDQVVRRLLHFADLPWTSPFERVYRTFQMRDSASKYLVDLDDQQIKSVEGIVGPLARSLGYPIP
jgi:hypothetical protein